MNHLAIYRLDTGLVVRTLSAEIVPDPDEGFAYIPYAAGSDPRGWTVVDGVLIPAVAPLPSPIRYGFNAWVDRFSLQAQMGIMSAVASDPMAKLIYDRAMVAGISGEIDPLDPRTIEGVQYLVSQGYISQADADAALAT